MKLFFDITHHPEKARLAEPLIAQHKSIAVACPEEADVIVSLGGDGTTITSLRKAIAAKKPVYGINFGRLGFLQNHYQPSCYLPDLIQQAEPLCLQPLTVLAETLEGEIKQAFAINEILVCNNNRSQIIFVRVALDNITRLENLGGDGLIVSSTIGSTSYNKSAGGPILPLGNNLLSITPNNPHQYCGRTDVIPKAQPIAACDVKVEVLEASIRTASLYADTQHVTTALKSALIRLDPDNSFSLLFDPHNTLKERVMRTQFLNPPTR